MCYNCCYNDKQKPFFGDFFASGAFRPLTAGV